MKTEETQSELEEMTDEEVEHHLKNLWEEARAEALNRNQVWFKYKMSDGEMEIDEVIDMLETGVDEFELAEGNEHK